MAGMGPPPKSRATRQRQNKTPGSAQFQTTEQKQKRPALGKHPVEGETWHARTKAWWTELWGSPMAKEYLRVDNNGLLMLATLIDRFWKSPSTQLSAEIRLQELRFGVSPMDRRRLQWEIVRATDAQQKRPPRPPAGPPAGDPRAALRAI